MVSLGMEIVENNTSVPGTVGDQPLFSPRYSASPQFPRPFLQKQIPSSWSHQVDLFNLEVLREVKLHPIKGNERIAEGYTDTPPAYFQLARGRCRHK